MKYVFIGTGSDDIKYYYQDFNKYDNTELVMIPTDIYNIKFNLLGKFLFALENTPFHYSRLAKRHRRLYNKADYFRTNKKKLYKTLDQIQKINKDDDVCFIVYARVYEYSGITSLKYLRKKFPKSRFVIFFGDVFSSYMFYSIERIFNTFEKVFSFDKGECDKYGFEFLQEPFSYVNYGVYETKNDISFVGAAKNRLDDIYSVYHKAKSLGLSTDFQIFNVKEEDIKFDNEIIFNKWLSFTELMKKQLQSKAILEILQKDGYSPTMRYAEALLYKKYLITNCLAFKNCKNLPKNVIYFENVNDIDFSKVNVPLEYDNSAFVDFFSVNKFIKNIEKALN